MWLGISSASWIGIVSVLAIVAGPIIAVQLQKWIERRRDSQNTKLWVFRELMATRGTRLSPRHVEALNAIELHFSSETPAEKKVVDAWELYFEALNRSPADAAALQAHFQRRDDLFYELLFEMSQFFGLAHNKTAIRRNIYTPIAHGQLEDENERIRQAFLRALTTPGGAIPIRVMTDPPPAAETGTTGTPAGNHPPPQ